MKYPDNEVVNITYNSQMQLYSLIGTDTYVQSSSYDSASRLTSRALGNGLTQTDQYYPWNQQGGRLFGITAVHIPEQTTYRLELWLRCGGQYHHDFGQCEQRSTIYGYDALNRLTSWTLNNGQPEIMVIVTPPEIYPARQVWHIIFTMRSRHAVASLTNGNGYTYDANGNMISRSVSGQTFNFGYDAENRLISVSGAAVASFVYDGDGNRRSIHHWWHHDNLRWQLLRSDRQQHYKNYYAGTQLIATRKGDALSYYSRIIWAVFP